MKEKKISWFDKVFKPERFTLTNGTTVYRPRSRTPLIALCILALLIVCIQATKFDLGLVISRVHKIWDIMGKLFRPDFSFFSKVVNPLWDTIKMSLLGSVIGCVFALPFSVIASSNINKNKPSLMFVRLLLGVIRTIPTLVLATIFALVFGLGTFAGTVSITIFTFGVVGKMLFESIETIDLGPFEALESLGCNKFQAFWTACIPQILPTYLSHCLYCFEMNVRAASILGYVGAGGLGIQINERVGWRDYNGLGMVLLTLFVAVLIIENISAYLRRKLS